MDANDLGDWTRPAPALYPHQWLWDSCFIAIGLAHTNPARAARELTSLGRGQWANGMLPHMIFSSRWPFRLESIPWNARAFSPKGVRTSGITQTPLLAIAAEKVAHALPREDLAPFLDTMMPVLLQYHSWIYRERDPNHTGLAAVIHPWESGLDDTPYWMEAMRALPKTPLRWRWLREYRKVRTEERARLTDIQHMLSLASIVKHYKYDSAQVLRHSRVVLHDLVFNCVLAAANESLVRLCELWGQELPEPLHRRLAPTRRALEALWDEGAGQYFSRDCPTGRLIQVPTVATFMPLFAGTASPGRAEHLRQLMLKSAGYNVAYPLPSVPVTDRHFEPKRYWCGPTWINMNWFVITGLQRYGFTAEAEWLRGRTLDLIVKSGFREYYNPLTGDGLGAHHFSWSAALALDLLANVPAAKENARTNSELHL